MASRGDIPGFVFDPVRGKYFPIQPNHIAPKAATYSKSAVNAKIQAEQLQKATEEKDQRLGKGRITRSNIHTPFLDFKLDSQLGFSHSRSSARNALAHYYANGLSYTTASQSLEDRRSLIGFAVSSSSLYLSWLKPGHYENWEINCHDSTAAPGRSHQVIVDSSKQISRMAAISQDRLVLAGARSFAVVSTDTQSARLPHHFQTLSDSTDLAVSPDGQRLAFTTGTFITPVLLDSGLLPILNDGMFPSRRGYMTTSFIDNNLLMSGDRSGGVYLSDFRHNDHVHRLHHSSAVNGIQVARTPNEIIVSGLQSISLYDLRYIKSLPVRKHHPTCLRCQNQTRRQRLLDPSPASHCRNNKYVPTQPLVTFHTPPDRLSQHYTSAGKSLAYIPSVDIAVVASHRTSGIQKHDSRNRTLSMADRVTLYRASTGHILPSVFDEIVYDGDIQQIGVHRLRDGPESILVCSKNSQLQEFRVDLPRNGQVMGDDDGSDTMMANADGVKLQYTIVDDQYPPDAEPRIAEMWERGNRGPG